MDQAGLITSKVCTNCDTDKPLDDFHVKKDGKHGRTAWCKVCVSARGKTYRASLTEERAEEFRQYRAQWHADQRVANGYNDRRIQRKFGLTPEEHGALLERANGHCSLCGRKVDKLYVDHDHETGKVREMLCNHCNLGLGHFRDNPELMELAAEYVRLHRGGQ